MNPTLKPTLAEISRAPHIINVSGVRCRGEEEKKKLISCGRHRALWLYEMLMLLIKKRKYRDAGWDVICPRASSTCIDFAESGTFSVFALPFVLCRMITLVSLINRSSWSDGVCRDMRFCSCNFGKRNHAQDVIVCWQRRGKLWLRLSKIQTNENFSH